MLTIFCDGGAKGNPGPAGIGVVIKKDGQTIKKLAKYIGQATNNVAEYTAVIEALKWINSNIEYRISNIDFFLDSKLVVNQLNGLFKIKDAKLRNLIVQVRQWEREIGGGVVYHLISREDNQEADSLVKKAIGKR